VRGIRRLFVDPASISTGWALFEGDKLEQHGTLKVSEGDALDRLAVIGKRYEAMSAMLKPDHTFLERMNHIVAYQVVWSVGVIATALRQGSPESTFEQISPATWKKYLNGIGMSVADFAKLHACKSEDQAVAIAMGLCYLQGLEKTKNE
jgi:Holliday junction resolvasome RuvABC endonuclease subunit